MEGPALSIGNLQIVKDPGDRIVAQAGSRDSVQNRLLVDTVIAVQIVKVAGLTEVIDS